MIKKITDFFRDLRDRQRIAIGLSKGSAMMHARIIDLTNPDTWEFSGFSQNGEDGIIDVLTKKLKKRNRYFMEIGSSDGIENNSAWLVIAEKYAGIMIEGDLDLVNRANRVVIGYSVAAECYNMFVTKEKIKDLKLLSFYSDPDIFSLDIDGNDYYIAESILLNGFRPKIFVVEYNAVFGSERSVTVEYNEHFVYTAAHDSHLYYGVSIVAWKKFFAKHGYRFVTVDRNGVNAFFVDPGCFEIDFLENIKGVEFAENGAQNRRTRKSSSDQFLLIQNEKFVTVED